MRNHDYLTHYGVKGMKWGVRKSRPSSSGTRKTSKKSVRSFLGRNKKTKKVRSTKTTYNEPKKKSVKKMTDDELKTAISRLELEKKYKNLNHEQLSVGRKLTNDILKDSAKNIGTQLVTYAMGTAVNKALKKEIVNPKKGQRDKK